MADADVSAHSKADTEHESEHALPDRCDYDLFLVFNLESLRVRSDGQKNQFDASRLPVSFQTCKTKGTIVAGAVLQNPAGCCPNYRQELDTK